MQIEEPQVQEEPENVENEDQAEDDDFLIEDVEMNENDENIENTSQISSPPSVPHIAPFSVSPESKTKLALTKKLKQGLRKLRKMKGAPKMLEKFNFNYNTLTYTHIDFPSKTQIFSVKNINWIITLYRWSEDEQLKDEFDFDFFNLTYCCKYCSNFTPNVINSKTKKIPLNRHCGLLASHYIYCVI